MYRLLLPLLALAACEGTDAEPTDSDTDATGPVEVTSMALATFEFAREADGVSQGFDLDANADEHCGIADFVSPDGREGIDNSFGPMLPVIETAGGQALGELIQREVVEGGFQLVFSWTAIDGVCHEITITRTIGAPMTSVGGELVPGQTLDPHPDPKLAPITVPCTDLDDGGIRAEGFDLPVVLQVFSTQVDLPLEAGIVEIRPTASADRWSGVIGGAIPMDVLRDFVTNLNGIGPTLPGILEGVINTRADIPADDGTECGKMSAVVQFTTLPAFVFDEPPPFDTDAADTDP